MGVTDYSEFYFTTPLRSAATNTVSIKLPAVRGNVQMISYSARSAGANIYYYDTASSVSNGDTAAIKFFDVTNGYTAIQNYNATFMPTIGATKYYNLKWNNASLTTTVYMADTTTDGNRISNKPLACDDNRLWAITPHSDGYGYIFTNKASGRQIARNTGATSSLYLTAATPVAGTGSLSISPSYNIGTSSFLVSDNYGTGGMCNISGNSSSVNNTASSNLDNYSSDLLIVEPIKILPSFTYTTSGLNVTFTNTTYVCNPATPIASYHWAFDTINTTSGDVTMPATGQADQLNIGSTNASYSVSASYTVTLLAKDAAGNILGSKTQSVSLFDPNTATVTCNANVKGVTAASTSATSTHYSLTTPNLNTDTLVDGRYFSQGSGGVGYWSTSQLLGSTLPQSFTIKYANTQTNVVGVKLFGRGGGSYLQGLISDYDVEISNDSISWAKVASGTLNMSDYTKYKAVVTYSSNLRNDSVMTTTIYLNKVDFKYLRVTGKSTIRGEIYFQLSEVELCTSTSTWDEANVSKLTAARLANTAKLTWSSTNESSIASYEVEKYNNGAWTTIGSQKANGSKQYSVLDKNLVQGENKYRVKVINYNGNVTYVNANTIVMNDLIGKLTIYPNPAKNNVNVSFGEAKNRTISISNINGKLLKQVQTNSSNTVLDISTLSKGLYILAADGQSTKLIVD